MENLTVDVLTAIEVSFLLLLFPVTPLLCYASRVLWSPRVRRGEK